MILTIFSHIVNSMILKDKSIIICGIVRNAEKGLRRNIPVIQELCSHFGSYKVVIYENDSIDKTKELLAEWLKSDAERIHIIMEDTCSRTTIPSKKESRGNPFFSEKRIKRMATLRNQYLEYIEKKHWEADFLLVVDLDVQYIDLAGVFSSFDSREDWDVVTAFGYSTSPKLRRRYHDTYALTELGKEDVPQTEKEIKDLAYKYGGALKKNDWIEVFSAFGGLAIYKFDKVKGLRYQVIPNNDSQVEVHCEHYSLYKQMAQRGRVKVFINPIMKIKYQRLTFSIIYNSLRRRFGV